MAAWRPPGTLDPNLATERPSDSGSAGGGTGSRDPEAAPMVPVLSPERDAWSVGTVRAGTAITLGRIRPSVRASYCGWLARFPDVLRRPPPGPFQRRVTIVRGHGALRRPQLDQVFDDEPM